ncbi:MAG: hypothetical protein ACO1OD_10935 [Croceibacterium sp.]
MKSILMFAAATAAAADDRAPPIWDLHERLICQETFVIRCKLADFNECDRGELTTPIVIIDFGNNVVRERFLSESDDEISGRLYRPTIGTYADSIIVTELGDMITIYPETEGAPGNFHALRQSGFLREARASFLTCTRDPSL